MPDLSHQHTLLLAMAWASVLTILLGTREAAEAVTRVQQRDRTRPPRKPTPARYSLFTLGLQAVQHWIDRHDRRTLPRALPASPLITWTAHWYAVAARLYIFHSVRP